MQSWSAIGLTVSSLPNQFQFRGLPVVMIGCVDAANNRMCDFFLGGTYSHKS